MTVADYVDFLERAARNQRAAQRFHAVLAACVVIAGVSVIAAAQLLGGAIIPENQKGLVSIGGTFISTLAALPIKQFADRRDKILALEFLRDAFGRLRSDSDLVSEEGARLVERITRLIDASLGR
jgi:hypothetical protein